MKYTITFLFLLLSLFNNSSLKAQVNKGGIYFSLDSPYNAIKTHLYFLEDVHYDIGIASKPFKKDNITDEEAMDFAIKLKKIFEVKRIYIDLENIPREVNYVDRITQKNIYYIGNRKLSIYLSKHGDSWHYSDETISNIDYMYEMLYPFSIKDIAAYFPTYFHKQILGIKLLNYILAPIVVFISAIIYYLFKSITYSIFKAFFKKWDSVALIRHMMYAKKICKLFALILSVLCFRNLIPIFDLSIYNAKLILLSIKLVLIYIATSMCYNAVNSLIFVIKRGQIEGKISFNKDLMPFLSKSIKTVVMIVGSIFILKTLNIDVSPIIASLSISSLGVALASQDTIKNLFGSIMIFIDSPFKVGDFIISSGIEGVVEEVGMRSTKLKTHNGSIIHIPNSNLANSHIDNYGRGLFKKYNDLLFLNINTPYEAIEDFIKGFKQIIASHQYAIQNRCYVYITDVTDRHYIISFELVFKKNNYDKEMMYRHDILMAVAKLIKELNIKASMDASKAS